MTADEKRQQTKPQTIKSLISIDLNFVGKMTLCGLTNLDTSSPKLSFLIQVDVPINANIETLSIILQKTVKQHALPKWPWTICLSRPNYQIQMMEAPNLPEEEIPTALKLRIKDFVNEPLENYVTDALLLPAQAFSGNRKMAFAIIINRKMVMDLAETMLIQGRKLLSIDIAEQAQRNLLSLSTQSPRAALLVIGEESSSVLLCYEQQVCLQRQLEIGAAEITEEGVENKADLLQSSQRMKMDSMALEIQRSFDYFESQLNLGGISELKIVQSGKQNQELCDVLSNNFTARVSFLNLSEHIDTNNLDLEALDGHMLSIGAALRHYEYAEEQA